MKKSKLPSFQVAESFEQFIREQVYMINNYMLCEDIQYIKVPSGLKEYRTTIKETIQAQVSPIVHLV